MAPPCQATLPEAAGYTLLADHGTVQYFPDFMDSHQTSDLYGACLEGIQWRQETIKIYGKTIQIPRLSAWYGDAGKGYTYSGITMEPLPWTEFLYGLKTDVEMIAGTTFNSVLVNFYRNGNDSMGWHSDDEPELGKNPTIASVSLGGERTFMLRKVKSKSKVNSWEGDRPGLSLKLAHGSLLLMRDEIQHYWQHQIPKTKKNVNPRINLTFRRVL